MRTLAQAGLLPTVLRLSDEAETAINLARPDAIGGESRRRLPDDHRLRGRRPTAVAAKRAAVTAVLAGLGGDARSARSRARPGRTAGSTRRTSATRCSTSASSSRRSRPRRSGPTVERALRRREGRARGSRSARARWCSATSRTSTRPAARSTSRSPPKEADDPLAQWLAAKAAASDAIVAAGATITHHHAVGTDHKPWLAAEIGDARRLGAARGQGRPRPDRRPQPGGADPVTDRGRFTFLVNPASGGGAAPGAVVPVARLLRDAGADGRRDLLARARRRWAPWSTPRSPAATSWSRSAATGCSRRSPAWSRPRGGDARRRPGRPRQRLRPDARAARRPGRASGRAAARRRAVRQVDLISLTLPGAAPRSVAGSVYAGVDARAAEIVDRAHWLPRSAAVPLRRGPRARDLPARPLPSSRSTATSASTPPPPSSSPTRPTTARA